MYYEKRKDKMWWNYFFWKTKRKLNSIETLVSQTLTDMEISHEGFITILNKKDKYEKMK